MRATILIVATVVLGFSSASFAEPTDVLLGEWVSPDGKSKQSFERELDGSWLSTRMWFRVGDEWKLVAAGGMYRKPGLQHWMSVSRTVDMGGIELFESTLTPSGEGRFNSQNVSFMADGSTMETSEEWSINGDRFEYKIYREVEGERTLWLEGAWTRD